MAESYRSPTLAARRAQMFLEDRGLVVRHLYSEHPPRLEYRLSPTGKTLGPVLKALREWGSKHT